MVLDTAGDISVSGRFCQSGQAEQRDSSHASVTFPDSDCERSVMCPALNNLPLPGFSYLLNK